MNQIKIESNQNKSPTTQKGRKYKRNNAPKGIPSKWYHQLFLDHYFYCHKFGHKTLDYKDYTIEKRTKRNRNYKLFSPLMDYNIECYKCNNYGHLDSSCRLPKASMKIGTSKIQNKHKKIWRVKKK